MRTREEKLAYMREWNARYLKSEKYEQRKAEARAKTAAYRQSEEYRQHQEKRRQEKLELKRQRDRRYRERMASSRRAQMLAMYRRWRAANAEAVRAYVKATGDRRAQLKRIAREELRDFYIKEQLGLRNPPQVLI